MEFELKRVFANIAFTQSKNVIDGYKVDSINPESLIKVGVSTDNQPVILIRTNHSPDDEVFCSQSLSGIEANFFHRCSIQYDNSNSEEGVFHIIKCIETSSDLVDFFFDFFELFFSRFEFVYPYALKAEIDKLSSLFSLRKKPGRQSMMGLWSELLVLSRVEKIAEWANAWHEHPRSTFDFRFQEIGIDVKSFGGDNREHFFKISQLRNLGVKNSFIISMCLKEAEDGITALDLLSRIEARLDDFELVQKIRKQVFGAAGNKISDLPLYSEEIACDSMMAIDASEIPCLDPDSIPLGVSEVKFKADCSGIDGQGVECLNIC